MLFKWSEWTSKQRVRCGAANCEGRPTLIAIPTDGLVSRAHRVRYVIRPYVPPNLMLRDAVGARWQDPTPGTRSGPCECEKIPYILHLRVIANRQPAPHFTRARAFIADLIELREGNDLPSSPTWPHPLLYPTQEEAMGDAEKHFEAHFPGLVQMMALKTLASLAEENPSSGYLFHHGAYGPHGPFSQAEGGYYPPRVRNNPMKEGWETVLPLSAIEPFVPMMEKRGVSEVARSPRGFLTAYREAGGDLSRMGSDPKFGQDWRRRRENFIKRHMGQIRSKGEDLWRYGNPSRRHLALIAWAYTPDVAGVEEWIAKQGKRAAANPNHNPRRRRRRTKPPHKTHGWVAPAEPRVDFVSETLEGVDLNAEEMSLELNRDFYWDQQEEVFAAMNQFILDYLTWWESLDEENVLYAFDPDYARAKRDVYFYSDSRSGYLRDSDMEERVLRYQKRRGKKK